MPVPSLSLPLRYAAPTASVERHHRDPRGMTARLLRHAARPSAAGLASLVTTAILLLPTEYEVPIRHLLLFLSSRRF